MPLLKQHQQAWNPCILHNTAASPEACQAGALLPTLSPHRYFQTQHR